MAIVHKRGHQIGDPIDSPAYLDANVLINYALASQKLSSFQTTARNVMGDLLAQRVTILISLVTVEEAWWVTMHEIYCSHIWQPSSPGKPCSFGRDIATQNFKQIMRHKDDLKKIMEGLQELLDNGADIRFVPESKEAFDACSNVPNLMDTHNLLSADALHLSLALSQAMTLITFDVKDFQRVLDPKKDLSIILLP